MPQYTIQELKKIMSKYERRTKKPSQKQYYRSVNKTFHQPKVTSKLRPQIRSPFYERKSIHIAPHEHLKKIRPEIKKNVNYLRKGHGQSFIKKRKALAQLKKQSSIKTKYEREAPCNKFKKGKKCLEICNLFKIKCENCKPKLDCFNEQFQKFLRDKHLYILTGLAQINDRLNLSSSQETQDKIRKDIVKIIENQIGSKKIDINKTISKKIIEKIQNKNKAALYVKWGIQVAKVIKKFMKFRENKRQKTEGQTQFFKAEIKNDKLEKIDSCSKKQKIFQHHNSQKNKEKLFLLERMKSNDKNSFSLKKLRNSIRKITYDEKQKPKTRKIRQFHKQFLSKHFRGSSWISNQNLKSNSHHQSDRKSLISLIREKKKQSPDSKKIRDYKNYDNRKQRTKLKRPSLFKQVISKHSPKEKLFFQESDDSKDEQFVREFKKIQFNKTKRTKKSEKGHKSQIEELKSQIAKDQFFIKKIQKLLVRQKMKDSILSPADSKITQKRKVRVLRDFSYNKKKLHKKIQKYIQLNQKNREALVSEQSSGQQIHSLNLLFDQNIINSPLYFYDLRLGEKFADEFSNAKSKYSNENQFFKIECSTSQKQKNKMQGANDYGQQKRKSNILIQKNLETHASVNEYYSHLYKKCNKKRSLSSQSCRGRKVQDLRLI